MSGIMINSNNDSSYVCLQAIAGTKVELLLITL